MSMDNRLMFFNEKKFVATAAESNFFEILEKDGLTAAKQFILVVYPKNSKKEGLKRWVS